MQVCHYFLHLSRIFLSLLLSCFSICLKTTKKEMAKKEEKNESKTTPKLKIHRIGSYAWREQNLKKPAAENSLWNNFQKALCDTLKWNECQSTFLQTHFRKFVCHLDLVWMRGCLWLVAYIAESKWYIRYTKCIRIGSLQQDASIKCLAPGFAYTQ